MYASRRGDVGGAWAELRRDGRRIQRSFSPASSGWPASAGWFLFYEIFALRIRRNDAFNTVTSIFYFVFLFASSMFYPVDPLPPAFRTVAMANPITWQVDVLRFATTGVGESSGILVESVLFTAFSVVCFAAALRALMRQE